MYVGTIHRKILSRLVGAHWETLSQKKKKENKTTTKQKLR
jgi:hypothetical protein